MAHPQENMASKYGGVRPFLLINVLVLDSQDAPNLVEKGMRKPLSNLADLPPDVQAYIAAQTAELSAECGFHKFPDKVFSNSRTRISVITGQRFQ